MTNLIVLAVVVASFITGFYTGGKHESARHTKFVASVEQEQAALALRAKQVEKETQIALENSHRGWSAAVDYYKRQPRLVRLQSNCDPVGVPAVSAPSPLADAPSAEPGFSPREIAADEAEDRLNKAVLDAAQVMHLQQFINNLHDATRSDK